MLLIESVRFGNLSYTNNHRTSMVICLAIQAARLLLSRKAVFEVKLSREKVLPSRWQTEL
jgi:hypothetical protein